MKIEIDEKRLMAEIIINQKRKITELQKDFTDAKCEEIEEERLFYWILLNLALSNTDFVNLRTKHTSYPNKTCIELLEGDAYFPKYQKGDKFYKVVDKVIETFESMDCFCIIKESICNFRIYFSI